MHYHYADSYASSFEYLNAKLKIEDVGKAFFSSGPAWIEKLFELRNAVVKIFGLKTGGSTMSRPQMLEAVKCEPGEKMGLFKVFEKTADEIILGEDDKHLDFKVSLLLRKAESNNFTIIISTVVIFHNWWGRFYFLPVKPFHQFIVPAMLKNIILKITKTD